MAEDNPRRIERPDERPVAAPAGARRRGRSIFFVLLAIAAGAAFIWWLTHRAPAGGDAAGGPGAAGAGRGAAGAGRGGAGGGRPPATVGVAKVVVADVPLTVDALGTVTPPVTATVRARIAGTLDKVMFTEGQEVRAGQLLAEVDPRPYTIALRQAQGNLARDQATARQAQVDLARYQTLLKEDSIARQQVDTQAATVGQLKGTIATDQAAVGAAQLNVTYTRIVAPVAGRVGLRQVDVGNYVTPADAGGVVVLTQVHPIDVVFTLPESQLPQVVAGARRGPMTAVALDRDGGTELARGTFRTFDNRVDTATGTVKAKARFDNRTGTLFPNQFVNIRLTYGVLPQAVTVPVAAVRSGPKGSFVFVARADRTAEQRAVTTGANDGATVAVLTGLKPGETVVTEGADKLADGGKIVLPGDKRPSGAGGGGFGGAPGGGGSGRHRRQGAQ